LGSNYEVTPINKIDIFGQSYEYDSNGYKYTTLLEGGIELNDFYVVLFDKISAKEEEYYVYVKPYYWIYDDFKDFDYKVYKSNKNIEDSLNLVGSFKKLPIELSELQKKTVKYLQIYF